MLERGAELQGGRYVIERAIGEGGMGRVYLATDTRFSNHVALKQSFATEGERGRAFEREARLLRTLKHDGLPGVVDYFLEDQTAYLVMDYVEGPDLGEVVEERFATGAGPLLAADVVRIGLEVLEVLEYLHAHEPPILHRDIKPRNLKATPNGRVQVLDFGLAKGSASEMSRLTGGGSIVGYSPHYAPLEQVAGMGTSPLSDLYALGATLYFLATGETPVEAAVRASATASGLEDPQPRADAGRGWVPAGLADVISDAMSPNPRLRPQSAAIFRQRLAHAAQTTGAGRPSTDRTIPVLPRTVVLEPVVPPRANKSSTARAIAGGVVGLVVAVLCLGIWQLVSVLNRGTSAQIDDRNAGVSAPGAYAGENAAGNTSGGFDPSQIQGIANANTALDPNPTEGAPPPGGAEVYHFPIGPLVEGLWHDVRDPQQERALVAQLKSAVAPQDLDAVRRIRGFRERPLACYGTDASLVAGFVESADGKPDGVIEFIRRGSSVTVLDGKSNPIHMLNSQQAPNLSTAENAKEYLLLFCAALRGDTGDSFRILENDWSLPWTPAASDSTRSTATQHIRPLAIAYVDGRWKATATMLYGQSLFNAILYIDATGDVEMQEDVPLSVDLPLRGDDMRGIVRCDRRNGSKS